MTITFDQSISVGVRRSAESYAGMFGPALTAPLADS